MIGLRAEVSVQTGQPRYNFETADGEDKQM
jgi:hypothetical protein